MKSKQEIKNLLKKIGFLSTKFDSYEYSIYAIGFSNITNLITLVDYTESKIILSSENNDYTYKRLSDIFKIELRKQRIKKLLDEKEI